MNPKGILLDTSFLYALADSKDKNHELAKGFLNLNARPLMTTNFIFDELVTIIRYDFNHQSAERLGNLLRSSKICRLFQISDSDEKEAWKIFCQYNDQDFSFTDCTSFALMNRLDIKEACTFDHHFYVFGFINALH